MAEFDMNLFRKELLVNDPMIQEVWQGKYRFVKPDGTSDEKTISDSRARMVHAVHAQDNDMTVVHPSLWAVHLGLLLPAGRINAGAGTGRAVSLINCFVLDTIQDSMPGIHYSISQGAFTMQAGGGIGSDFSTIRPRGALVLRTGSVSTGVIPYMDEQHGMCETIKSAGTRRGAMMACLSDTHPDLWNENQHATHTWNSETILTTPSFITAKHQKGRLTNFNVSVLVSDAFLAAVERDDMWDLGFHVPRADGNHVDVYDKPFPYDEYEMDNEFDILPDGAIGRPNRKKGQMLPWYVYTRVKARRIMNDMQRSTYVYSEPGVVYIDRVNQRNNLWYCEDIRATNPCGEQPLPPSGACNLGSVNLAFMVDDPFTPHARFDFNLLRRVVKIGVRFLDNVLDVTNYPLKAQAKESELKRRIGLGPNGFGDALIQLGITYGSTASVQFAHDVGSVLAEEAYDTSSDLAIERGAFPMWDRDKFMNGYNVQRLPKHLQEKVAATGLRNGVLLTIAPNGTNAIYNWNISGGHEPIFSYNAVERKIRQPDGTHKTFKSMPYSYRLYNAIHGDTPRNELPPYFVGALDISVDAHLAVHAAWQDHIDASISKTINVPVNMSEDNFKDVYSKAYALGAKGCTTYRDDPVSGRGSILSEVDIEVEVTPHTSNLVSETPLIVPVSDTTTALPVPNVPPRPRVVVGRTYKLTWPQTGENWYITINSVDGAPFETFIVTAAAQHSEWVQAMSRLLTAVLRRGGDVKFVVSELFAVHSPTGGAFIPEQHKFRASVVAAIGGVLEEEFKALGLYENGSASENRPQMTGAKVVDVTVVRGVGKDSCPECGATPLVHEQGCVRCLHCDYSKC